MNYLGPDRLLRIPGRPRVRLPPAARLLRLLQLPRGPRVSSLRLIGLMMLCPVTWTTRGRCWSRLTASASPPRWCLPWPRSLASSSRCSCASTWPASSQPWGGASGAVAHIACSGEARVWVLRSVLENDLCNFHWNLIMKSLRRFLFVSFNRNQLILFARSLYSIKYQNNLPFPLD